MTTLRIDNGDLADDPNTGVLLTVSGLEEGAQNVAGSLLREYNSYFDEGNELLNFTTGGSSPFMTDALVQQFITESINRLILKQRELESNNKIIQVNQVKTRLVGMTTLVFYVEVLFENGQTVSIVDQSNIRPVSLDHILNPSSLITI